MPTHDTDPQREPPAPDDADASRTEPGPPPDAADDAAANAVAAALLADLAKAPLPTEEVRETEGHVAASYAVAPHRPPRANDKTIENPAVLVNATMPLPPPPSSSRMKLGPPAPSVVSMKGEPTVPGGAHLFLPTSPAERAQNQSRVLVASVIGALLAALIATALVFLFMQPKPAEAPEPASPPATITAPATATVTPTETATPAAASVTPPATTTTTTSTTPPTARTAPKPTTTSRPPPSPRPSGNFAEPDRSF